VLPAEGGMWTADQYTFRLIRDGDISEVVEDPPPEDGARKADHPAPEAELKADDDDGKKKKPR
jgi:hypothetical protein